jgi:hypothetical protein
MEEQVLSPLLDGWRNGEVFVGFDADGASYTHSLFGLSRRSGCSVVRVRFS